MVRVFDTSPKGDGSWRRYFLGDEEEEEDTGAHLLLFDELGLSNGSKSIVLFRVAPQAMVVKYGKSQRVEVERNVLLVTKRHPKPVSG